MSCSPNREWTKACVQNPSCPEPRRAAHLRTTRATLSSSKSTPSRNYPFSYRNRGQAQHFRQSTLKGCRDEASLSSRGSMRNLRQSQQLQEDAVENHPTFTYAGEKFPTRRAFPQRVQVVCSRRGIRHCHVFVHRRNRVSDPGTTLQGELNTRHT